MNGFKFVPSDNHMSKPVARHIDVSRPIIGTDETFGLDDALDKRDQTISGCIRQMLQSKSSHYFIVVSLEYFYSNANQCFAASATSSLARFFTAYICFINLGSPAQFIAIRSHHSTPQFVQPLPSRMIAPQTQKALQAQSISPILLICYMPHGTKPHCQRLTSSVQDRSRSHRGLPTAFSTMEQSSTRFPNFLRCTMRANKSVRPSEFSEIFNTGRLGTKPTLKLQQSSWVIFLHTQIYYILWLLESSAYPHNCFT